MSCLSCSARTCGSQSSLIGVLHVALVGGLLWLMAVVEGLPRLSLTNRRHARPPDHSAPDFVIAQWLGFCVVFWLLAVEYFIYLYILLLSRLSVYLWFFPSGSLISSKVSIISLKSRDAPEGDVVLHLLSGAAASSPNVMFSTVSALASQK